MGAGSNGGSKALCGLPTFASHLNAPQQRRGFSLAELIIIISIIGVAAAIAAPRYSGALQRYQVNAAARRLVADIKMAQDMASSTSSSRTITFDAAASKYAISGVASLSNNAAPYELYLSTAPYKSRIPALALGGGATAIAFDGYGTPDRGGSITISSGTASRTITINAITGAATIQ